MENCNRNHKRDLAIIVSILLHIVLLLFLFYSLHEHLNEETNQKKDEYSKPIFLSQDLASQVNETNKKEEPVKPQEEINEMELSSQINENNIEEKDTTEYSEPDVDEIKPEEQMSFDEPLESLNQDIETQNEPKQDINPLQELETKEIIKELPKEIEKDEIKEQLEQSKIEEVKKPVNEIITQQIRKRYRRSIMPSRENMPIIPHIIDDMKNDLKTNLFKMISQNPNQSDIKYLSYQQSILNFFENSFTSLYVGKSLGIPKHEFDQLALGIVIEMNVHINKDGTIKWMHVRSQSPEFNKCIEKALENAAPFAAIPKQFNMDVFYLRTKLPMGLQASGKGIMQVYPT